MLLNPHEKTISNPFQLSLNPILVMVHHNMDWVIITRRGGGGGELICKNCLFVVYSCLVYLTFEVYMANNNVLVGSIELFVNDIEKSKQFYEAIGIELEKSYYSDWPTDIKSFQYLGSLKDGQGLFHLHSSEEKIATRDRLWLYVDNVSEIIPKLLAVGAEILRPNPRAYAYATLVFVKDPDGRVVCLKQNGT